MFHAFTVLARSAAVERITLLVNHVLAAEPVATERLRRHAGARVRVQLRGWPGLLPPVPVLLFSVTPAGLLEWRGDGHAGDAAPAGLRGDAGPCAAAELEVTVDASNPALLMLRQLSGMRARVDVAGDAALASDISWLIDNVRWDIEDDLARIVGAGAAHELARVGRGLAAGLRESLDSVGHAFDKLRPARRAAGASPGVEDPPR